jgi:hypothetical protein
MDVLNLEIQIAQNDLQNVEINLNAGELMVAGISLTGDEVNEVLSLVRRLNLAFSSATWAIVSTFGLAAVLAVLRLEARVLAVSSSSDSEAE